MEQQEYTIKYQRVLQRNEEITILARDYNEAIKKAYSRLVNSNPLDTFEQKIVLDTFDT